MNQKNIMNYLTWWLDFTIINVNSSTFKYSQLNNIYYVNIKEKYLYFFFLINKNNINSLNFYNLDITNYKILNKYKYFIAYQSIFFDFKILIDTTVKNTIQSLSTINKGSLWLERENKEFSSLQYTNLNDTRKLLSNYNYNNSIQYNQFNSIINDLKI